jgi:starch synthase
MEILMVAAELSPYARESEAADTVASLGRFLVQLGHDVTVALPRYSTFEDQGLLVARRLTPLRLASGESVTVFDGQLGSGVKIVLFDAPELFSREGVYRDGEGKEHPDNARRFALLAHAAAALAVQRASQGQAFDVAHLHDWPGALAAVALAQTDVPLPKVLTIHDVAASGSFPVKELPSLGIADALATEAGVRLGNRINVLKGGIQVADAVTTVSPTYARELSDPEHGGSLAPLFESRSEEVHGVLSGLDYGVDNPATDTALPSRFNAERPENKGICKTAVIRELDLDLDLERPLVVALGPLTRPGGGDLLAPAAKRIVGQDATLVVAGSGAPGVEKALRAKSLTERDNYAFMGPTDPALERRLLAAADLAILPSRYDRSGLVVRRAQRYGAAPVARAAGAVCDVVVDCDADLETGSGFTYADCTPEALVGAVSRGLAAYSGGAWGRLTRRLLRLDASWEAPARRYLKVYKSASA